MTLRPDDFARVEAIFAEAVALSPPERAPLLDEACAARPDLRREVETLLAAHDRAAAADVERDAALGARVGAYRLVAKIGEGGMGEVYRAARADGAFDQQVAVKLTRAALDRGDVLRRFKTERQILASLQHPNIVTLLDGGTTEDGRAYLAMEYAAGLPITSYCRERQLALEGRLRLFLAVCAAVQYAHEHAVVHRDLKPANIVVTTEGVAKVLDFGVAKLLESPAADGATTHGGLSAPLTPNYASPEQLRGLAVTTVSDVYALGVLLYELLSDQRPYETAGLPLDRVLEIVLHDEPPRPSVAAARAALPYPARRLAGDLDAIVARAMAKQPAERYHSAGELAADVTRYLSREPIVARARSATYVVRRIAARHRAVVGVTAAALVAVIAAGGAALWQRDVARRAQARAEQRLADTRRLANALIFQIHDAIVPLAGSTPVRRTIVNEAAAYLDRIEGEAPDDPSLRLELASAHGRLGSILGNPQGPNLGDRAGAIRELERARALVLPLATGDATYDALFALVIVDRTLANVYLASSDRPNAVARAREAVASVERFSARHPDDRRADALHARALFELALVSDAAEAPAAWQRTRVLFERELTGKPHDPDAMRNVALVDKYLGGHFDNEGRYDAAAKHYESALGLDERRLAMRPDDRQAQFDLAISLGNAGAAAAWRGDVDQAAVLHARSVAARRRLAESDPQDVFARERLAIALSALADAQRRQQRFDGAAASLREALALAQAVLDATQQRNGHSARARALLVLGRLERARGREAAACAAYRQSADAFERVQQSGDAPRDRAEAGEEAIRCGTRRAGGLGPPGGR